MVGKTAFVSHHDIPVLLWPRYERAFKLAHNSSRCREPFVMMNPDGGHDCSRACCERNRLQDKVGKDKAYDLLKMCTIAAADSISNAVTRWRTFVSVVTRQIWNAESYSISWQLATKRMQQSYRLWILRAVILSFLENFEVHDKTLQVQTLVMKLLLDGWRHFINARRW